ESRSSCRRRGSVARSSRWISTRARARGVAWFTARCTALTRELLPIPRAPQRSALFAGQPAAKRRVFSSRMSRTRSMPRSRERSTALTRCTGSSRSGSACQMNASAASRSDRGGLGGDSRSRAVAIRSSRGTSSGSLNAGSFQGRGRRKLSLHPPGGQRARGREAAFRTPCSPRPDGAGEDIETGTQHRRQRHGDQPGRDDRQKVLAANELALLRLTRLFLPLLLRQVPIFRIEKPERLAFMCRERRVSVRLPDPVEPLAQEADAEERAEGDVGRADREPKPGGDDDRDGGGKRDGEGAGAVQLGDLGTDRSDQP